MQQRSRPNSTIKQPRPFFSNPSSNRSVTPIYKQAFITLVRSQARVIPMINRPGGWLVKCGVEEFYPIFDCRPGKISLRLSEASTTTTSVVVGWFVRWYWSHVTLVTRQGDHVHKWNILVILKEGKLRFIIAFKFWQPLPVNSFVHSMSSGT